MLFVVYLVVKLFAVILLTVYHELLEMEVNTDIVDYPMENFTLHQPSDSMVFGMHSGSRASSLNPSSGEVPSTWVRTICKRAKFELILFQQESQLSFSSQEMEYPNYAGINSRYMAYGNQHQHSFNRSHSQPLPVFWKRHTVRLLYQNTDTNSY